MEKGALSRPVMASKHQERTIPLRLRRKQIEFVVASKDPHVVDTQASEDHAPNELSAIKVGTM
jgi:hypothetical protein